MPRTFCEPRSNAVATFKKSRSQWLNITITIIITITTTITTTIITIITITTTEVAALEQIAFGSTQQL
jgi:hypothetical protein